MALVLAPAFGLLVERVAMRPAQVLGEAERLVVPAALLSGLITVAQWIWNPNVPRTLPTFLANSAPLRIGPASITWHQAITMIVAAVRARGRRAGGHRRGSGRPLEQGRGRRNERRGRPPCRVRRLPDVHDDAAHRRAGADRRPGRAALPRARAQYLGVVMASKFTRLDRAPQGAAVPTDGLTDAVQQLQSAAAPPLHLLSPATRDFAQGLVGTAEE